MDQQELYEAVEHILERNRRVEADKAWETSWFRIITICGVTYVIAGALMVAIGVENIFRNALIPTIGFLLSTQSLPFIKRWWIRHRHQKQ